MSLKSRWIEALNSGNYKQGADSLKFNGCHCALGVLGEIHEDVRVSGHKFYCGESVSEYLLFNIELEPSDQNLVAFLNDGKSWPFKDIAAYIEKYASDDLTSWTHPSDLVSEYARFWNLEKSWG